MHAVSNQSYPIRLRFQNLAYQRHVNSVSSSRLAVGEGGGGGGGCSSFLFEGVGSHEVSHWTRLNCVPCCIILACEQASIIFAYPIKSENVILIT